MRNRLWLVQTVVVAAIIVAIVLSHKRGKQSDGSNESPPPAATPSTPSAIASPRASVNRSEAPTGASRAGAGPGQPQIQSIGSSAVASSVLHIPPVIEFTNFPPVTVLENMRSVFHSYASALGSNPTGTNPEITAALKGENPKQTNFLKEEEGQRVNAKGELIDPWGTPYFFHALSGKEMEIHSAGPDGIMWTGDDLVMK
jgi:hypothetical protein